MLWIFISILTSHFVADFVLQTNQMATLKSRSIQWLSYHVGVYTLAMATLMVIFLTPSDVPLLSVVLWVLVNGALHWMQDFGTSRWTSKLWAKHDVHNFFVVIGLDQLLHYTTFLLTGHFIFHLF